MNKERFISLIRNPALLSPSDQPFLEEIIKEYPYFSSAHLLYARLLKNGDSILLHKQIKISAVMVPDRKVLFNLLEKPVIHAEKEENIVEKTDVSPSETKNESEENITKTGGAVAEKALDSEEPLEANPIEVLKSQEPVSEPVKATVQTEPALINPEPVFQDIAYGEAFVQKELIEPAEKEYLPSMEKNDDPQPEVMLNQIESDTRVETEPVKASTASVNKEDFQSESEDSAEADFMNWLKKVNTNDARAFIPRTSGIDLEAQNIKTGDIPHKPDELVEKFIQKAPERMKPASKSEFFSPVNKARESVTDNDYFVTETLAKIYIKQGNLQKALKVYQKLVLDNPEKSNIFASQIKKLTELIALKK